MKKKIISLIAGVAFMAFMPACTNLDEKIYDKLPATEFGNTQVEINALLGSTYNTLKQYFPERFTALEDYGGSMAVTPTRKGGDWYDGGQYREIYMHTWTSRTNQIMMSWTSATSAIGRCNKTLETVSASTILTEADRTMKLAELRGVRAFWIYAMMDSWGNIPLVTDYANKELPACTPRQDVFNWLIKEVAEIAESCPEASKATYGKFTKGAAYTLLSKLYLNAEAWDVTVEGGYTAAYTKVAEYCTKVMNMGFYILEPNWKDNFIASNNNSKEAILAVSFSSQDTSNDDRNQLMNRTLHYKDQLSLGGSFSAWNGVCAQPDYVKLFDTEDPRYEGSFLIGQQYNLITGEKIVTDHGFDLNHTVDVTMLPGTERDGTNWGDVNQHDGARCIKWTYEKNLSTAMENDFHIFRLADVYLMKAEALLRGTGNVGEATSLVNAVRERAYGKADKNYTTVDLDKVALERKFEFAWEAMSRQDDIRFGTFEKGMWTASNCERKQDKYLRIFPISQNAWQTNPKLVQNPGYPTFTK